MGCLDPCRSLQYQIDGFGKRKDFPSLQHLGKELPSVLLEGDVSHPIRGLTYHPDCGDVGVRDGSRTRELGRQGMRLSLSGSGEDQLKLAVGVHGFCPEDEAATGLAHSR
jgi:hypothetical protein